MANYPLQYIDEQDIKIRWGERYVSAGLNERMLGIPVGVYRGFVPVVVANTVELRVDADAGDSIACVESSGSAPGNLGMRVDSTLVLNFSGHSYFPVFVVAESSYSIGSATTAVIKTIDASDLLATLGASPATVDLSTVAAPANLPIRPSTAVISVTLNGGAAATITDDGAGNLSGTGLSGVGTINYTTGAMVGTTQSLQALSTVSIVYKWDGLGRTQVLICKVDKPGATLVVTTAVPDDRHEPFPYIGGSGFGFMPDGSLEILQAAALTTAEVDQAHTGFLQTFANLDARLDAELAGGGADGMAGRLALRGKMIETKAWDTGLPPDERYWASGTDPGWSGAGVSANVSDDFRGKARSTGPTVKGVVTDDYEHDSVMLMDRDYQKIVERTGLVYRGVYGRLTYNPDAAPPQAEFTLTDDGVTGITFNKGAKNVVGSSTAFHTEVEAGDIIEGADGVFYTVDQVNDATHLDLLENYSTGTGTESAINRRRRRYTLLFYTWNQGTAEQPFTFPAASEFRFWYQEIFDAADPVVYADMPDVRLRRSGVAPEAATTSSAGVVELATDGETAAGVVVQGNDSRLVSVGPNIIAAKRTPPPTGSLLPIDTPSGARGEIAFVQGANVTINVYDDANPLNNRVVVEIAIASGSFPGFYGAAPPADATTGSAGGAGTASRGDHYHPLSSSYKIRTYANAYSSKVGDITFNPTFTPRMMLFMTPYSVGYAIGISSGSQACWAWNEGGSNNNGAVKFGNIAEYSFGGQVWNVGTWTDTDVTINDPVADVARDIALVLIGDNLPA